MKNIRCPGCGRDMRLEDSEDESSYHDIVGEDLCWDCRSKVGEDTPESRLLDAIFGRESESNLKRCINSIVKTLDID